MVSEAPEQLREVAAALREEAQREKQARFVKAAMILKAATAVERLSQKVKST